VLLQRVRGWKVDYPMIKEKKKESKPEANLTQVVRTEADGTS